jgi:hypothetical protein
MHRKNIRLIITKQLTTDHPHWKKMNRKSKKKLLQQIVDESVKNYDYSQTLDIPHNIQNNRLNRFIFDVEKKFFSSFFCFCQPHLKTH